MQTAPIIFEIIVVIFSIIIHEISHGYVAELLGDPTPRLQGRLTLNPLKHIDPIGSIAVPIVTSLAGFTFGWAKPVQFNPYNLKNRRIGELIISLAGPFSNLLIAIVFGTIIRYGLAHPSMIILSTTFTQVFIELSVYIVLINISLAIFNLIPFPPLDGSKIVFAFFPQNAKWNHVRAQLEAYSIYFVIFLVVFLWHYFSGIIPYVFQLFTGIAV